MRINYVHPDRSTGRHAYTPAIASLMPVPAVSLYKPRHRRPAVSLVKVGA